MEPGAADFYCVAMIPLNEEINKLDIALEKKPPLEQKHDGTLFLIYANIITGIAGAKYFDASYQQEILEVDCTLSFHFLLTLFLILPLIGNSHSNNTFVWRKGFRFWYNGPK